MNLLTYRYSSPNLWPHLTYAQHWNIFDLNCLGRGLGQETSRQNRPTKNHKYLDIENVKYWKPLYNFRPNQ